MAVLLGEVTAPAPTPTAGTDWGGILSTAIPAMVAARHQDKVMKLNLQRERDGLPLLDLENYQPGVKVGIDKGTRNLVIGIAVGTALLAGAMFARS